MILSANMILSGIKRLLRPSRAAMGLALGAAMTLAPIAAHAQTQGGGGEGGSRGDRGGGGGGSGRAVGAGIVGAVIGIGVGLLIEGARAKAEREDAGDEPRRRVEPRPRRVAEEEPGPRRRAEPKPKVVRATAEPPSRARPAKAKPERAGPKTAARNPSPPRAPKPFSPPKVPALVQSAETVMVPDEVLFEVRPGTTDQEVAALAARERLARISSERFELTGSTVYRYRIRDNRDVASVVAALSADARVSSAQPNHVFSLSDFASELAAAQYAPAKLRLSEAHASATGAGVTIAVIDSGIDPRHPALKGAFAERFDPVGGTFKPHPHGTAVAGLAAARGDLASPAPGAKILAIRAFAPDQPAKPGAQGTTMHILRGLDFAAARGAKIVNMSFAGPFDAKIASFVAAGAAKGAIHIAAAGNAGPKSPPLYPAADPNVIAVTATDAADGLLAVANRGGHLAIAAPGVDVLVAAPGDGFAYMSGTSMASAEIAGVVAMMLQAKPGLDTGQVRSALAASARDLGAPGRDSEYGAGGADAKGALDAVAAPATASVQQPAATPVSATAADVLTRP